MPAISQDVTMMSNGSDGCVLKSALPNGTHSAQPQADKQQQNQANSSKQAAIDSLHQASDRSALPERMAAANCRHGADEMRLDMCQDKASFDVACTSRAPCTCPCMKRSPAAAIELELVSELAAEHRQGSVFSSGASDLRSSGASALSLGAISPSIGCCRGFSRCGTVHSGPSLESLGCRFENCMCTPHGRHGGGPSMMNTDSQYVHCRVSPSQESLGFWYSGGLAIEPSGPAASAPSMGSMVCCLEDCAMGVMDAHAGCATSPKHCFKPQSARKLSSSFNAAASAASLSGALDIPDLDPAASAARSNPDLTGAAEIRYCVSVGVSPHPGGESHAAVSPTCSPAYSAVTLRPACSAVCSPVLSPIEQQQGSPQQQINEQAHVQQSSHAQLQPERQSKLHQMASGSRVLSRIASAFGDWVHKGKGRLSKDVVAECQSTQMVQPAVQNATKKQINSESPGDTAAVMSASSPIHIVSGMLSAAPDAEDLDPLFSIADMRYDAWLQQQQENQAAMAAAGQRAAAAADAWRQEQHAHGIVGSALLQQQAPEADSEQMIQSAPAFCQPPFEEDIEEEAEEQLRAHAHVYARAKGLPYRTALSELEARRAARACRDSVAQSGGARRHSAFIVPPGDGCEVLSARSLLPPRNSFQGERGSYSKARLDAWLDDCLDIGSCESPDEVSGLFYCSAGDAQ